MLILGEPYRHLGLYVHAPVEIGRTVVARGAHVAAVAPMVLVAAAGGRGAAGHPDEIPGGSAESKTAEGSIVHLVSASDLVAFCDARVLEGFRRKV